MVPPPPFALGANNACLDGKNPTCSVPALYEGLWSYGLRPCIKSLPPPLPTVGECEIHKEARDVLEDMRKLDECDMEEFDRPDRE